MFAFADTLAVMNPGSVFVPWGKMVLCTFRNIFFDEKILEILYEEKYKHFRIQVLFNKNTYCIKRFIAEKNCVEWRRVSYILSVRCCLCPGYIDILYRLGFF
jgi:hypothetical protein